MYRIRNYLRARLIVGTLPNNIQNGQAEDAVPVMANLNWIINQVNANAQPLGLAALLAAANSFTQVQSGVAATSAANFPIATQVQNRVFNTLTSTLGTNTITGRNAILPLSAYAVGQAFSFIPSQQNTGSATYAIDGLGSALLKTGGQPLVGRELGSSTVMVVVSSISGMPVMDVLNPQIERLTGLILGDPSRFKFSDIATSHSDLVGQLVPSQAPSATLTSHYLAPAMQDGRHYVLASVMSAGAASSGDKVAMYGVAQTGLGSSNVWGGNFLAQWNSGDPQPQYVAATEIDVNNNNTDSVLNPGFLMSGVDVVSGGSKQPHAAITIRSVTTANRWRKGIQIGFIVGGVGDAQGVSDTGIEVGAPTAGLTAGIVCKQLVNGGDTFLAQRFTDSFPTGQFFRAVNAANTESWWFVDGNSTANETNMSLTVSGVTGLRVKVGAADSGGAGFRMLRVAN
jgi:hypothetical protein